MTSDPMQTYTIAQLETELRNVFRERKRKDSSYSYRTMAKELDFNFSTLYRVLKGERRLGRHSAKELSDKLGVTLVSSKTKSRVKKKEFFALSRLNPFSETQVHWLCLAILESLKLPDFEPSPEWIANRFGLRLENVETVLKRMETEGLLTRSQEGWRDAMGDADSDSPEIITTQVVRAMLKDIMAVSSNSVENVPFENREHSFAIFPVASKQLPLLKSKLNRLRQEFASMAEKSKYKKDEVYAFHLGFFPLTKDASR